MSIEAVTYISDLNAANPVGTTDPVSDLDNHIRNMKTGIKATFPNISAAVTPTHTELNYVDGVTSPIQTQIDTASLPLVLETATAVTGVVGKHHALTNVALSTVTLSITPAAGDTYRVTAANGLATNVINPNGAKIMGVSGSMTIDRAYASATLRYINSTIGYGLV